jgi:hypothetical protein
VTFVERAGSRELFGAELQAWLDSRGGSVRVVGVGPR